MPGISLLNLGMGWEEGIAENPFMNKITFLIKLLI